MKWGGYNVRIGGTSSQVPMSDTGERVTDQSPRMVRLAQHRRYALAASLCRGTSILDVGCGIGQLWHYVSAWCSTYTGVDKPGVVAPVEDPRCWVFAADDVVSHLHQYGLKEQVDTVVAIDVIEHIDPAQQEQFVKYAWLATRKRLIISTGHPDALRYYPLTEHFLGVHNPWHTREPHPAQLLNYIAENCLRHSEVQIQYCVLEHDDEQYWTSSSIRPPIGYVLIVDR